MTTQKPESTAGILTALGAYVMWGLLPLYWKTLKSVPPSEILGHRMVWSLVFLFLLLAHRKRWHWIIDLLKDSRTLLRFVASASLLAINWFTFIWAVNNGYVLECSLGYFINPLISVLLGVVILRERLRLWQGVAIAIAFIGVAIITIGSGEVPIIALTLAVTFALYGLLRKTASLESLEGLSVEMTIMFVPALGWLLYLEQGGSSSFGHGSITLSVLLALTGVMTSLPLLLFARAARRVTLTTVGLLQYFTPSLHFILGVFVYSEPFTSQRLMAFVAVWIALAVYATETVVFAGKRKQPRHYLQSN